MQPRLFALAALQPQKQLLLTLRGQSQQNAILDALADARIDDGVEVRPPVVLLPLPPVAALRVHQHLVLQRRIPESYGIVEIVADAGSSDLPDVGVAVAAGLEPSREVQPQSVFELQLPIVVAEPRFSAAVPPRRHQPIGTGQRNPESHLSQGGGAALSAPEFFFQLHLPLGGLVLEVEAEGVFVRVAPLEKGEVSVLVARPLSTPL